ncbi:MAG: ParB/RepB/Spo0J family partition protein [Bdellovibrionales bacterium]|nr:ParB/RepB/Spo0J family partition protein [Bdellovibrionales bacterium]
MANKKAATPRKALGRGLSALISNVPAKADLKPKNDLTDVVDSDQELLVYLPIEQLEANPDQPRKEFDEEEVRELSTSIKTHGLLQPILVRKLSDSKYQIIAGERRWRACRLAKLEQVPVFIKDIDDVTTLELALIENIQRSNLGILELARAYQFIIDEHNLSQQQVADRVGKDRSSIANVLRLLKLPPKVQEYLQEEKLTLGHAKAILTVKEPAAQINLAEKCIAEGLSVRDIEAIVSRVVVLPKTKEKKLKQGKASDEFIEIQDRLRKSLGTKVLIEQGSKGKGQIQIQYFSPDELARLVDIICGDSLGSRPGLV